MAQISMALQMLPPLFNGTVFFVLGLVIGSFTSVLCHRLPRREDFVVVRSHCPNCRHTLSALDLVPVFSFLWLRGACRYCGQRISWHYPALELGCGLSAGGIAMVSGPPAGAVVLGLWIVLHVIVGWVGRQPGRNDQSGSMLAEVLIGVMLLGIVLAPIYDAVRSSLIGRMSTKHQAAMIGYARRDLAEAAVGTPTAHGPESHTDSSNNTTYAVTRDVTQVSSTPETNVPASTIVRYKVTTQVTCTSCRQIGGQQPSLVLSEVVTP